MKVDVKGCAICAPGLPDWPRAVEVLCGRAAYDRSSTRDAAPVMMPPNERRRLPATARVAIGVGAEALQAAGIDAAGIATVFTSCGSDAQITHEICKSLSHVPPDVSPTRFHNSVHNAPGGYWSIALRSRAPSTSLCAYEGSFSAGLLEAAAQVLTEDREVLLIAYDLGYPAPLLSLWNVPLPFSVALLLAPHREPGGVAIEVELVDGPQATTWPVEVPLEVTGNPAGASVPLLSLLARGVTGRAVLPSQPDNAVAVTLLAS